MTIQGDHLRRARRVISRAAVDEHIDVGVNVGEHAAHHMPLTLTSLTVHDSSCFARDRDCTVLRVVVVDINLRTRQSRAEIRGSGQRPGWPVPTARLVGPVGAPARVRHRAGRLGGKALLRANEASGCCRVPTVIARSGASSRSRYQSSYFSTRHHLMRGLMRSQGLRRSRNWSANRV
jgi:hypothetical protein